MIKHALQGKDRVVMEQPLHDGLFGEDQLPAEEDGVGILRQDLRAARLHFLHDFQSHIIQSFRVIPLAVHERDVPGDVLFTLSFKVLHLLASLEIPRVNNAYLHENKIPEFLAEQTDHIEQGMQPQTVVAVDQQYRGL